MDAVPPDDSDHDRLRGLLALAIEEAGGYAALAAGAAAEESDLT